MGSSLVPSVNTRDCIAFKISGHDRAAVYSLYAVKAYIRSRRDVSDQGAQRTQGSMIARPRFAPSKGSKKIFTSEKITLRTM